MSKRPYLQRRMEKLRERQRSRKPSPSTTRLPSYARVSEAEQMRVIDNPLWLREVTRAMWTTPSIDDQRQLDMSMPPGLPGEFQP